jgi:hypothetical protein
MADLSARASEAAPGHTRPRHAALRVLATILGVVAGLTLVVVVWHGAFVGTTRTVKIGPLCSPTPKGEVSWYVYFGMLTPTIPPGDSLEINTRWIGPTRYYWIRSDGSRVQETHWSGRRVAPSCP